MPKKSLEERREQNRANKWAECRDPQRWPVYAARRLKKRALEKGIPFDLVPEDLVLPEICPVYKVPFVLGDQRHPNVPSVDRIRPELGYVKGNIAIISRKANLIKQDCTSAEDVRAVADYMDALCIAQAAEFIGAVMDCLRRPRANRSAA